MIEKNINLHKNHRQRLKKRFIQNTLSSFEDHQILEMLLFYSIPQKDTNELAHILLNRFKTLSGVFDASYEELLKVPGIKEHSATLIKLIPQLAQKYCSDRFQIPVKVPSHEDIGRTFINYFIGKTNEEVVVMLFDNSMQHIKTTCIHTGNINSASFSLQNLVNLIVEEKASFIVLAHNHPQGTHIISHDDIETTRRVKSFLIQMNTVLLDHFIVCGNYYSTVDKNSFEEATLQFRTL